MSTFNAVERKKLTKLSAAIQLIRDVDSEMPLGQIMFFLTVAQNEGKSLREIAEACGFLVGTASRYMANLMFIPKYRQNAGVSLIHAYDNPTDRRQKVVVLTPAGKKLIEGLIEGS